MHSYETVTEVSVTVTEVSPQPLIKSGLFTNKKSTSQTNPTRRLAPRPKNLTFVDVH